MSNHTVVGSDETHQHSPRNHSNIINESKKLSHKQWRAKIRRDKRKLKRQEDAKNRENSEPQGNTKEINSDDERLKQQRDEAEAAYLHKQWLEREKLAMEEWQRKKAREEKEKQRREEQERKIKEEWEERQKEEEKEREIEETKEKAKKTKQEDLLRQATANENKTEDGPWHNPIVSIIPGRERDKCPFFIKTGACRFGERCSRVHPQTESSCVVLFPGMYTHFELEQGLRDEYDTDLILEYEDSELYQNFSEFYEDIVPEFKSIGTVIQVKICCNYEPHLRGNVYVQYKREEDAATAVMKFNGRFYAGKQVSCNLVDIINWKSAICGLFGSGRCPKGKNCNFLHVFKNPNNEFWDADRRVNYQRNNRSPYGSRRSRRYSRSRSRSREKSTRESRERSYRSKSRRSPRYHRSRSRDRQSRSMSRHRYSRSKSKERKKNKSKKRKHSRSRSNSRSRSRSKDRKHKNKKKDKKKSRSHKRSKSRDRNNDSKCDSVKGDSTIQNSKNSKLSFGDVDSDEEVPESSNNVSSESIDNGLNELYNLSKLKNNSVDC